MTRMNRDDLDNRVIESEIIAARILLESAKNSLGGSANDMKIAVMLQRAISLMDKIDEEFGEESRFIASLPDEAAFARMAQVGLRNIDRSNRTYLKAREKCQAVWDRSANLN